MNFIIRLKIFINRLLIFHPIIFKVLFGMAGTIVILILIMNLRFIREKFKEIKAKKQLEEVKNREENLNKRKKKLDEREKKLEYNLELKYQKKKEVLKRRNNKKLKQELDNIAGLPTEEIIKRYGRLLKKDELDSLWDI